MPRQWYIKTKSGHLGPVSSRKLARMARKGKLDPNMGVSNDAKSWFKAKKISGLEFPDTRPEQQQVVTDSGSIAEVTWFVLTKHHVAGPFTHRQLRKLARRGKLDPNVAVSRDQTKWMKAKRVPGLRFGEQLASKKRAIASGESNVKPASDVPVTKIPIEVEGQFVLFQGIEPERIEPALTQTVTVVLDETMSFEFAPGQLPLFDSEGNITFEILERAEASTIDASVDGAPEDPRQPTVGIGDTVAAPTSEIPEAMELIEVEGQYVLFDGIAPERIDASMTETVTFSVVETMSFEFAPGQLPLFDSDGNITFEIVKCADCQPIDTPVDCAAPEHQRRPSVAFGESQAAPAAEVPEALEPIAVEGQYVLFDGIEPERIELASTETISIMLVETMSFEIAPGQLALFDSEGNITFEIVECVESQAIDSLVEGSAPTDRPSSSSSDDDNAFTSEPPANPWAAVRETDYAKRFGPCVHESRRDGSDGPPIDVLVYPPSADRPATTMVTSGMSDYSMLVPRGKFSRRAELLLYVDQVYPEHIQLLRSLAQVPQLHTRGYWYGETMGNGSPTKPIFRNSVLDSFLFMFPMDADFKICESVKIHKDPLQLLWVVPISSAERRYVTQFGMSQFCKLLDLNQHPLAMNPMRPCYVASNAATAQNKTFVIR